MRAKARRREAQFKSSASVADASERASSVRWQHGGVTVALVIITLAAFSNSFTAGFTLDSKSLLHDPRIVDLTIHNFALILHHSYWWPGGEAGLYRPFTTLSYLFNYSILGNRDQPQGYHWVNFALQASNVLLVYFLLLRFTQRREVSAFMAAAWGVHPVLTESVTNIVGRSDLLAGCATLGGFLMYLWSTESEGWRRAAWLSGLAAITFVGVFSKESAVCVVGVIVLYELLWRRTRAGMHAVLLGFLATGIPIAIMLYQRSRVLSRSLPAEFPFTDNPIVGSSSWIGRLTALKVVARYLWLSVWPATLSCDYSYSEIPLARGTWSDWACWMVVLCAIVAIAFAFRWSRIAFFFACFAAITFFPMSNLAFPIGTIMAERFLYLPSLGVVVCVVVLIYGVTERMELHWLPRSAMCVIIICSAARTWARNTDWQDESSIIAADLKASPNSYKLHKQMATLLLSSERTPENIHRGSEAAEKSVALLNSLPDAENIAEPYCVAGEYRFLEGELQNGSAGALNSRVGVEEYREGIDLVQRCAQIDKTLHDVYLEKLRTTNSAESASKLIPSADPQPYLMLSVAYVRLDDAEKATEAAREALRLHPRSPAGYRQIANVFMLQNRRDDAASALTEGILLTWDQGLMENLQTMFEKTSTARECELIQSASGPTINPQCAPVRQLVCRLSPAAFKVLLQRGREDLVEQRQTEIQQNYRCAVPLVQR